MPGKREDVISWDEFFMRAAVAASLRSKDPNTQVGACIANTNNRILSVGYNGTPAGLDDDDFPWESTDDPLLDKHNYVIHAEANAILNYRGSLKDMAGATVFVTLFPCHECAKTLVQAGIGEVVYLDRQVLRNAGQLDLQEHPRPLRRHVSTGKAGRRRAVERPLAFRSRAAWMPAVRPRAPLARLPDSCRACRGIGLAVFSFIGRGTAIRGGRPATNDTAQS